MKRLVCLSMTGALALALMAFGQPGRVSAADTLQRIPSAQPLQPAVERVRRAVVSSALPDQPVLAAGGGDVIVRLLGSALDLITSAKVLLNGSEVSNVTARPGTMIASERELILHAETGAAAGTYQVRILAGDLTAAELTAVVRGPRTLAGADLRTKSSAQPSVSGQTALSPKASSSTGGLAPASGSSLKVASGAAQDRNAALQTKQMAGETLRPAGTAGINENIRNSERSAGVTDRLAQMGDALGAREGLEQPGSDAKGLDALPGRGDLSARLGAGKTGGGKFDLGPLGDTGTAGGQSGGMEGLLANDWRQNPKGTPAFTPGAGDSRLMTETGSGGTSSHIDIMEDRSGQKGDDSSQDVSRTEYHWGPDGSRTVITTSTNPDGSVNQSVLKVNEDGSVEEDNTTTSTSSGESTSSSSSGSGSSSGESSSSSSGSSGSSSGESSSSTSGESSSSTSGDEESAESTPVPDDMTGGGGGKTWDQLTDDEKQEICDMYEEQRQSVMGDQEGTYSVGACAEGPRGPDWQGLMEVLLNPYILTDSTGETGIGRPSGGISPGPVQSGTQPIPIDPDNPSIAPAGGSITNLPSGTGVDISIPGTPGTSANPDRP